MQVHSPSFKIRIDSLQEVQLNYDPKIQVKLKKLN